MAPTPDQTVQAPHPSVEPSTSNVDTTIPVRDMSAQPAVPSVQPTPNQPSAQQPSTVQPAAPQTTPAANQQPTPRSLHSKIFDGVLNTLGGGPVYVTKTDPTTGETTRVPVQQTRGQLGKSILAGALAGMFGGMGARDPEGRHDPALAASQGFQAGTAFHEKVQQKAQQYSDEELSRRQMTMKANIDVAHQTLALNQGKLNQFAKVSENNQNSILKDAQAYDQSLTDKNQPKAIVSQNLTHDEALAALKGHWSDQLAQIDGYKQTENGDIVPTFTVLNPSIRVKMSEKAASSFARFNDQYRTAWDDTKGNIQMGLHQYAIAQNSLNSLEHMDAFFGQEVKALGLKNTDFANAVKSIGPVGMKAVIEAENAIGSGGTPVDALRRLSLATGGAQILNKLGITGAQVETLYHQQVAADKLAEMGGIGDKAPADPEKVAQLPAMASQLGLSPAQTALVVAKPNKAGMTQGEFKEAVNKIQSQANANAENALKQGDPEELAKTGNRIVFGGDPSSLDMVLSARQNVRDKAANIIHDLAENAGLDTTKFTPVALKTKSDTYRDFSGNKKGTTGAQIASFNAFLGHTASAVDATEALRKSTLVYQGVPAVNTTVKVLNKQFANSTEWKAFQTSLAPVQNEISNFLAAGYATKEEDAALMHQILSDNETPERINAALKKLAETADIRLAAIGQRYLDTMDMTYPKLMSADSRNTLKRLGIPSKADAVAQVLPRGWQDGQAQKLTNKDVMTAYFRAAGQDKAATRELLKMNGWN